MKKVDWILKTAKQALNTPHKADDYVIINHREIEDLAKVIKIAEKPDDSFFHQNLDDSAFITVYKELIASSINYCYFYGSTNLKWVSSTTLYKHIDEAFKDGYQVAIKNLKKILIRERYPMLEERINHLEEIEIHDNGIIYSQSIMGAGVTKISADIKKLLEILLYLFPGFASDIFLKRAFLFFMQLNRKLGWFDDIIKEILVPADYQLPKILRHFECLTYSDSLEEKILKNELIPKHSLAEIQIRAATILVCYELQRITGWNACEIDSFLWLQRKEVYWPFHLTITTDY